VLATRWGWGWVRSCPQPNAGPLEPPTPTHSRTCPPNVPAASPYRGRSNHGIRVTISRDVDMKRKVDWSSVIQSLPTRLQPLLSRRKMRGRKKEEGRKLCRAFSRGGARSCSVRRGAFNCESRERNLRGYNQPTRPDGSALSALTPCAPRSPPPLRPCVSL
jgi:hypothetical protein